MISKVMKKVQMDQVKIIILIAPTRQGQPWYTEATISDFHHFKATSISDFLEERSSEKFIWVSLSINTELDSNIKLYGLL